MPVLESVVVDVDIVVGVVLSVPIVYTKYRWRASLLVAEKRAVLHTVSMLQGTMQTFICYSCNSCLTFSKKILYIDCI